jgi:hypothetical protein
MPQKTSLVSHQRPVTQGTIRRELPTRLVFRCGWLALIGKSKLHCEAQGGNINLMGRNRIEDQSPDLFSTEGVGDPSTNQAADVKTRRPRRPALPKDLPHAIKYLDNGELDRLLRAAMEEARRRGRLAPTPETPAKADSGSGESLRQALPTGRPTQQQPAKTAATPLTRGQMNAVWAAFKAGVTPSRIARQFGLSQSQVRKALTSDEPKR